MTVDRRHVVLHSNLIVPSSIFLDLCILIRIFSISGQVVTFAHSDGLLLVLWIMQTSSLDDIISHFVDFGDKLFLITVLCRLFDSLASLDANGGTAHATEIELFII